MLYYSFFDPNQPLPRKALILFVAAWVAGITWYFVWKARSKKQGVDISVTFGELLLE